MFCNFQRSACSLARAPYCTVIDWSLRATAVPRAGVGPFSPVYQDTVLAAVPGTSVVAELSGTVPTRSGGLELKKLSDAASAEAPTRDVSLSLLTAAVSAACRLA